MLQNELFFSYVDESDKDILALEKELDIEFAKASMALEYVDRMYEINTMKSDLRVLTENGTYDDINFLYEEAQKEANGSKKGIIATLIEKIQNFLHNLSNMFTKKFGDKAEEQIKEAADSGKLGSLQIPKDPNKVLDAISNALTSVGNFLKPGFHVTNESGEKVLSVKKTLITTIEAIGAATIAGLNVPKLIDKFKKTQDDASKLSEDAKKAVENADESKLDFLRKCVEVVQSIVKYIAEHLNSLGSMAFSKISGTAKAVVDKVTGGNKNKSEENKPAQKTDNRQYAQPDDNPTAESADDNDDVTVDDTVYESCDEIIDLIDNL